MIRWDLTEEKFGTNITNTRKLDWVITECDSCNIQARRKYAQHKQVMKKKGRYLCRDCATKSVEFREACSNIAKDKWQEEEYRSNNLAATHTAEYKGKLSKSSKEAWENEERRRIASEQALDRWKDEEYRNNIISKSREAWVDERCKEQSKKAKELWKNEEYRKKITDSSKITSKKMWEENRDGLMEIFGSEEFKNKIREIHKNNIHLFKSDEFRNKSSVNSKKMWEENRDKLMETFQSDEYREKMKDIWLSTVDAKMSIFKSDEFRNKSSVNSKKMWEESRDKLMETFRSDEFINKSRKAMIRLWREDRDKFMEIFQSDVYRDAVSNGVKKWRDDNQDLLEENRKKRKENFINRANIVHGDKYDYSEVIYNNSTYKVNIICPVHGHFKQAAGSHINNQNRCPRCATIYSRFQGEVFDFVRNLGFDPAYNDRTQIKPLELDVYVPEKRIAIECHGIYWHSYDKVETAEERNKHNNKHNICEEKDIRLIQVFENEWRDKREIVESIISNKLGRSGRIFARKCEIKKISSKLHTIFMNQNHIQGGKGCSAAYGLFYQGELVSAMSFNKHPKYQWEITRFANKINTAVVGGAGRLFKRFIKDNNPKQILTYADRRYSNGDLYNKLGFRLDGITKPNYCYVKNNKIHSRQQFQKHKLKNKLDVFDVDLTEAENMFNNGYRRLWDAGNMRFIWEKQELLNRQKIWTLNIHQKLTYR